MNQSLKKKSLQPQFKKTFHDPSNYVIELQWQVNPTPNLQDCLIYRELVDGGVD